MNNTLDSCPFLPSLQNFLDQVRDVHWHFLDLGRVELLDITHHPDILCCDKVDRNTNVRLHNKVGDTPYDRNVHHDQFGECNFRG